MEENITVLTCVYCGDKYPHNTPTHGSEILTAHIEKCEKHPLFAARQKIKKLRKALADLIDEDDIEVLKMMLKEIDKLPATEDDKIKSKNAINTLIEIRE